MILQGCNEKNEENNQYLNKIWVLDLGEGYSTDISLYITEIDSGHGRNHKATLRVRL